MFEYIQWNLLNYHRLIIWGKRRWSPQGVSPDMLLEQTYNADTKDKTSIDGITLNIAARTIWVYTMPVTAAVSTQLKTMLHIHTSNPQGIPSNMINISTWQCAENYVKDNLIREQELGLQELSDSISGDQQKKTAVRLKTFYTQNASRKKYKHQPAGPRKNDEVAALLRMTQIVASGGEVDIVNFIGNNEYIKIPPSLFNEDGTTSAAGTKANLYCLNIHC